MPRVTMTHKSKFAGKHSIPKSPQEAGLFGVTVKTESNVNSTRFLPYSFKVTAQPDDIIVKFSSQPLAQICID